MLAPTDQALLAAQMGRTPRGVVAIAARCPAGHPAVATCYPLRRERGRVVPFPTLYWLTCPRLCRELAHLEREGMIARLQARLEADAAMMAALAGDHERYIAERWALLSVEDRLQASGQRLAPGEASRGIGGMTQRAAVKCLHVHFAQYLVGGNTIGRLLEEECGVRVCGGGARARRPDHHPDRRERPGCHREGDNGSAE